MLAMLAATAWAATPVTLTTSDGKKIAAATDRVAGAKKGVVLVHQIGGSSADWASLSERLAKAGVSAISPDLRGYGKSQSQAPSLQPSDYLAMTEDVRAAVAWLRAQGATEISCAGASIGANLCLVVAATDPGITNLALLSPGLNYKGVITNTSVHDYASRPVLFVVSKDDSYAYTSTKTLHGQATGKKELVEFDAAGHGTRMFGREGGLEGTVLSWLLATYDLAGTPQSGFTGTGVDPSLKDVSTSGKKLE